MYRRHLEGLAVSEVNWNPATTVDALLRLAALAEAEGGHRGGSDRLCPLR
jgi:hypothetical protein